MKKKALIISTVVMVVVLIASLTTATYAWFSQEAKAKVDPVTIQTSASAGFQIAVVNGSDLSNGTHSLDENKLWKNTTQGGWGDTVAFTTNETDLLALNGVTGTGVASTMIMPKEGVDTLVTEGANSTKFISAVANQDYFSATLAIYNQDAAKESKNLKADFSVTSVANNIDVHGMVAALRIAIIYTDDHNTETTDDDDTYLVYINPCADAKYNKSSKDWGTHSGVTNNPAQPTDDPYEAGYVNKGNTTLDDTNGTAYAGNLAKGTVEAKDGTSDHNWVVVVNNTTSVTGSAIKTSEITFSVDLGAIAKSQVRNFTLVMWYEGEDAECIKTLAGGGATIGIVFNEKTA